MYRFKPPFKYDRIAFAGRRALPAAVLAIATLCGSAACHARAPESQPAQAAAPHTPPGYSVTACPATRSAAKAGPGAPAATCAHAVPALAGVLTMLALGLGLLVVWGVASNPKAVRAAAGWPQP